MWPPPSSSSTGRQRLLDYPALDEGRAPTRDRSHVAILAALVAGGAVLRLIFLGEPMRFDETFTFLEYATKPVSFFTTHYEFPNNHMLHTLGVHFTWRVFGDHVWTVRAPAFAAGVLLIPAVYLAARALYSRQAALWAAALTAVFAPLVDYSVNGRGYMLGTLLSVVALWLAATLLERPRLWWAWAGLVVSSALAVYTVPTFAFAVATVATWMGLVALVRRDLATLARLAAAAVVAAGLDLLLYSAVLGDQGWTFAQPIAVGGAGGAANLYEAVWDNWNRSAPHPIDWMVAAGFVASVVLHRRLARHPVPLVLPAALVAIGVFAIDRAGSYSRLWLYLLPLYLIHASAGLAYATERAAGRLPRPGLPSAAAACVTAAILFAAVLHDGQAGSDQTPRTHNDIVGFLGRELGPGQPALLDPKVAYASTYYFVRYGYFPPRLPPVRTRLRALFVVVEGRGVADVHRLAREVGWRVQPGTAPRLVRRFEYVEAWEARIE